MVIEDMKSGLTSAFASVDSKMKDSISFLKEMKEASWDKINTLVGDILV